MIELLISACLIAGGGCRDHTQLFDAREVSLMTCMMAGQPAVAHWQQSHPGWRVQRWRCRMPDRREASA